MTVYYKIAFNQDHPRGPRLEYHCGRDREAVANLQSFSKGIRPRHAEGGNATQVATCVQEWMEEIAMLGLEAV